jgi:ABC-type lipoprotein export system ATPase subunit
VNLPNPASHAPLGVSVRGVTKRYRATGTDTLLALDDVDLEIAAGEFVVVRGRSGSGKTTLLNVIAGLTTPTEGSVMLGEVDLWALPDVERSRLRREHFGFVFQFPSLMPTLTVLENVLLPAAFGGWRDGGLETQATDLLDAVGIPDKAHAYPRHLSAGQQQRVVLARALIMQPRLLLADEPTSNLDERTEADVLELFADIHRSTRVTVVMVTHAPVPAVSGIRSLELASGRLVVPDTVGT